MMPTGTAGYVNLIRSGFSFISGTMTGNLSAAPMPPAISAELTNFCNLACPECASGSGVMKRERGFMDLELFKGIIREAGDSLYYLNLYYQGEPMLHPGFFSFLQIPGSIFSVVSTNGHFLSRENSEKLARSGLKKLIVSLDGMDQATYSAYRRKGEFSIVTGGIENVSEAIRRFHSSLRLEIQFLVNRINEHQIPLVRRFAGEHGASLKLKSMQITSSRDPEEWMPRESRFRRYVEGRNGQFRLDSSLPGRCMRLWFNPVITWDGKVLPCCFDKDGEYILGDLQKKSLKEIWNGPEFRNFRNRVIKGRKQIAICRNCTSGIKLSIAT